MDRKIQKVLERQNPWWFGRTYETGHNRLSSYPELIRYLDAREILLIQGVRRSGKSTLMFQMIEYLISHDTDPGSILYINLDEPLFTGWMRDPGFLNELIEEYLEKNNKHQCYLFIDEIQNYEEWVGAVKVSYDINHQIKWILTGSTSSLLKRNLATKISGRYLSITVYPLSFKEYLSFLGETRISITRKNHHFENYLKYGGFPRIAMESDTSLRHDLLTSYYETIYLKDIMMAHNIRNPAYLVDLLYYLISNTGNLFSYKRLGEQIGISTDTVREYIDCALDAYLLYPVLKYDPSVKKQLYNMKKLYCIDTGLVNAVSFKFSENAGKILENYVFTTLIRRKESSVFYHQLRYECDFLIQENHRIVGAIQVCISTKDPDVRKREIRGLIDAMESHPGAVGYILTMNESERFEVNDKIIQVMPAYEYAEKNKK
ncbi:MAG: ATP-binding protein [Methanomicrobiales archaeon]|jgi:predicted AAA+ superfamily ATPase|nr:ATP-binding protein [Methanomicrobiales archaeon]